MATTMCTTTTGYDFTGASSGTLDLGYYQIQDPRYDSYYVRQMQQQQALEAQKRYLYELEKREAMLKAQTVKGQWDDRCDAVNYALKTMDFDYKPKKVSNNFRKLYWERYKHGRLNKVC